MPLKHQGVQHFLRKRGVDVLAILETKLSHRLADQIVEKKFVGWKCDHNFSSHAAGRILILWKPQKVTLTVLHMSAQLMHCSILDSSSGNIFQISFVYGMHSITARRALWTSLLNIGATMNRPWLILGDFNTILCPSDKHHGNSVTAYETSDFRDCCEELGVTNLNNHGSHFTWTNGRVWSKLDRVLCNHLWSYAFQESSYESPGFESISDHSPLIVSLGSSLGRGNVAFKFHNSVSELPSFLPTVYEAWKLQVKGIKMFAVCKRLKHLKGPLKRLYNEHFSRISNRIEEAEAEYNKVLGSLQLYPNEAALLGLADSSRRQIILLRKAEASHFSQILKNNFLLQADRCSKFFHEYISSKRHQRFIAAIHTSEGNILSLQCDIAQAFVCHYKDLLGVERPIQHASIPIINNGPKVPSDFTAMLLGTISKSDVWNIVAGFDDNKSPGPDGFNAKFFKESWSIIGEDIF
ncbi:uncharacterized protein LOC133313955 [Gastrolobium bilobum]|uniref:uncharacterized protein LOC133313955 n=1 Tax=Gastrolobium bilobum TaxID=150636 RepID=UPI002AB1164B|nr:uncharacterized protein LOC133313955 [Gastrolobium bilobum]